jgi:hypothetical protein
MDDDILDSRTGKPRRHDGRDPWSLMPRAEALARSDLGAFVPPLGDAPEAIAVGGYALLLFERQRADLQGRYEALWVEVTGADESGFAALLDNQPTWIRGLSAGDALRFEARHVLRFRAG